MEVKETKYEYVFATETVEIEITEEWAAILKDMDRREYNINHKETRRHEHYEDEGEWALDESAAIETVIRKKELRIERDLLWNNLTDDQVRLVKTLCIDGVSECEYAEKNGVTQQAITNRMNKIRKKLEKFPK